MSPRHLEIGARLRRELERHAGELIREVHRARWGTETPSAIVEFGSGRRLAVQRHSADSAEVIQRATALFLNSGIPAPRIQAVLPARQAAIVLFEFLPGEQASEQLGTPLQSAMAGAMGGVLRAVRGVDTSGWSAAHGWGSPARLRSAAGRWLGLAVGRDRALCVAASAAVERLAARSWSLVMSHGDFVPANALMRNEQLVALVDLASTAPRHPLVDTAWWLLVVRHHHPEALLEVQGPFLERALGGQGDSEIRDIAAVAMVRALELHAAAVSTNQVRAARLVQTALAWLNDP